MPRTQRSSMRTTNVRAGEVLHIETPNGIVNIYATLHDRAGRDVDAIEIIPSNYAGEPRVDRRGPANVRLVRLLTRKA